MAQTNKFWNVKTDGQKSRIDLFGYVGGSKDWNFGFNEEDFLNEIRDIPAENNLEIFLNSTGGDVNTALSVYELIKNHKGQVTIRISGVAMSAATIISSAPNAKVIMPKGSLMMIHKVSTGMTGNADEFRKIAETLDVYENNVLEIYAEKTGKTVDEIRPFVDAETYFTASEAVEFGLADEMDENETVKNEAVGNVVMVNGLAVDADIFKNAPKGFINKADVHNAPANHNQANKEEKTMTLEQLKAEHPELVEAIRNEAMNEGIAKERTRIQEIENLGLTGHDELVNSAKFENCMTAEKLAVEAWKAEKTRNAGRINARIEDAAELNGVTANAGNEGVIPGEEQKNKADADREAFIAAGRKAFFNK